MRSTTLAVFAVAALAAIVLAEAPDQENTAQENTAQENTAQDNTAQDAPDHRENAQAGQRVIATTGAPGRFTITNQWSEGPILLDTVTGKMWTPKSSAAIVDARMVAWMPVTRVDSREAQEAWAVAATEKYNRTVASYKRVAESQLEKKLAELGADHPEVSLLSKEIEDEPMFQAVTVSEMRQSLELD